jgi:alcohol dehydrogenase class IV
MANSFNLAPAPGVYFGTGKISVLPSVIKGFGGRVLLVTGAKSFTSSTYYESVLEQFQVNGIRFEHHVVSMEPTPTIVDDIVVATSRFNPEVVVAIGGGSVVDAGKAISAMLPLKEPVKTYLEGVGAKPVHPGLKIPFIAVPTTAGTGSEAAKNAVLSEPGEQGYKRSLRHNNFVPNVAIIDPLLTMTCSKATTAASGMDAFTQLLESYLSTAGNSVTDALAHEGLEYISNSLLNAYHTGSNVEARTGMALAAYLSGITLTNAGLGLVHGFAASVGGYFTIPHGIICSSLMPAANFITVRKLRTEGSNNAALRKYADVGKIFAQDENKSNDYYVDFLLDTIHKYAEELNIPRLVDCSVSKKDFEKIVRATDNKNNPVPFNAEEMMDSSHFTKKNKTWIIFESTKEQMKSGKNICMKRCQQLCDKQVVCLRLENML